MKNSVKKSINFFKLLSDKIFLFVFLAWSLQLGACSLFASEVKEPNVAGMFYPDNPTQLAQTVDDFIEKAAPEPMPGNIFAVISPHAGYGYSGQVAAYGYKLVKDRPYTTVVVIGSSHHYAFQGISVYPQGAFRTPLGDLPIDEEFAGLLLNKIPEAIFQPLAFAKEHSVEVQLPFIQRVLPKVKIVPVIMGECSLEICQKFAQLLKEAIGKRRDVLLVASTDMYHGYDYEETEMIDTLTLGFLETMDAQGLYFGLKDAKLQLCGGYGVVSTLIAAKELGHNKIKILHYTNSAQVTGVKKKGAWIVGYSSGVIDAPESS
ncbi:MAG: AmmeMemoRadiSam system protein B, partial [Candidatus Omnitrophica bacterium]|nr:AmmeMemoRadiSam system protein B [Candidatus Omnitrophota bacterium]